jgi:hypothetical protein
VWREAGAPPHLAADIAVVLPEIPFTTRRSASVSLLEQLVGCSVVEAARCSRATQV